MQAPIVCITSLCREATLQDWSTALERRLAIMEFHRVRASGNAICSRADAEVLMCCTGLFIYGYCIYYYFFRSDM